jgi:hypothetical protein
MKHKKNVYYLDYSFDNFLKYNEEYFWNKGIDVDIYLLINPIFLKKNGGERLGIIKGGDAGNTDNISLTVPYRYFHDLVHYLSLTKEDTTTNEEEKKKSIFMEAFDKIQIIVNRWEDKWNEYNKKKGKVEEPPKELSKEEKTIFFSEDFSKYADKNVPNPLITLLTEKKNEEPDNSDSEAEARRGMDYDYEKKLKIESDEPIQEFEKENTPEILEESVLENTREYKLLNR